MSDRDRLRHAGDVVAAQRGELLLDDRSKSAALRRFEARTRARHLEVAIHRKVMIGPRPAKGDDAVVRPRNLSGARGPMSI